MRTYFFVFAICALAASPAISAAQRWNDETENVSRTLKLEPGGKLVLKSFSGRVTITGTDAAEVVVNAVRRAPRERLNRITLDIHAEGSNTVYIDANHRDHSWYSWGNNVVDTDLEVKVPRKTNLDVSVFSAGVTVDAVEGSHKMSGFSSRLTLNDVSGPVKAHTFSGPIIIRQKNWEPNQQIDVDTFSGNVELHVPESVDIHGVDDQGTVLDARARQLEAHQLVRIARLPRLCDRGARRQSRRHGSEDVTAVERRRHGL